MWVSVFTTHPVKLTFLLESLMLLFGFEEALILDHNVPSIDGWTFAIEEDSMAGINSLDGVAARGRCNGQMIAGRP
jgi:hypothetical protein